MGWVIFDQQDKGSKQNVKILQEVKLSILIKLLVRPVLVILCYSSSYAAIGLCCWGTNLCSSCYFLLLLLNYASSAIMAHINFALPVVSFHRESFWPGVLLKCDTLLQWAQSELLQPTASCLLQFDDTLEPGVSPRDNY